MIEPKVFDHPLRSKRLPYFEDTEHGRQYSRIIGGVIWPTTAFPGTVAVFAETLSKNVVLDRKVVYVLAEVTLDDAPALLRKCFDYSDLFHVSKWYGDDENLPMITMLAKQNEDVSDDEGLHISPYPLLNDKFALQYYISLIRGRVKKGKKSLYFGRGSQLAAWLAQVTPDDVRKGRAVDHPAIVIVGGVLAVFERKQRDYSPYRELEESILSSRDIDDI